jgi:hypothetical protein
MATGLERGETAHEADEFMTTETVTLSRALQLIEQGDIKDGKTALGILFAAGFRAAPLGRRRTLAHESAGRTGCRLPSF